MILTHDKSNANYQVRSYRNGELAVNESIYKQSLIITANELIIDWPPQSLAELQPEHWSAILILKPEIVLLGTGLKFHMPQSRFLAPLYQNRIGVESMDTGAACRTYMALIAEGRAVLAALLIH